MKKILPSRSSSEFRSPAASGRESSPTLLVAETDKADVVVSTTKEYINDEYEGGLEERRSEETLSEKSAKSTESRHRLSDQGLSPEKAPGEPRVEMEADLSRLVKQEAEARQPHDESVDLDYDSPYDPPPAIPVLPAKERSMETIEAELPSPAAQRWSSPRSPARDRPWNKDLYLLSPRKFEDFTDSRIERMTRRIPEPELYDSDCYEGEEEEKKSDEAVVRVKASPQSLTNLAVQSIHAVDFDKVAEGTVRVTLSSDDEDSTRYPRRTRSVLPAELPDEFSNILEAKCPNLPSSKEDSGAAEEAGVVFGNPATFEADKLTVSERAKALANWKGGRGSTPAKKATYATYAQEILAAGDLLVGDLERAKSTDLNRSFPIGSGSKARKDLADDAKKQKDVISTGISPVQSNNILRFWKSATEEEVCETVEWVDRDPALAVLDDSVAVSPVRMGVFLDNTASEDQSSNGRLSVKEAYADEIHALESWCDGNRSIGETKLVGEPLSESSSIGMKPSLEQAPLSENSSIGMKPSLEQAPLRENASIGRKPSLEQASSWKAFDNGLDPFSLDSVALFSKAVSAKNDQPSSFDPFWHSGSGGTMFDFSPKSFVPKGPSPFSSTPQAFEAVPLEDDFFESRQDFASQRNPIDDYWM
jgi:hypothetical protein